MSGTTSDFRSATFTPWHVVSRHVLYVSRHFVRVHCACERRHFVPAVMSSRHLRFVATRHLPSRHLFVVMSRHIATCRDMSRRNATYTHLCCFNFIYIFVFFSMFRWHCTRARVLCQFSHVLAGHIQWSEGSNPSVANTSLLSCTHTPRGVFYTCKINIEIEYYFRRHKYLINNVFFYIILQT